MDELLDMIATDSSASDISDSIKDTLYAKAAERINTQRPDIAAKLFDPSIADGTIPDPNMIDPITGEPLEGGGDLGNVPKEPDLESDAEVTDAQFQKDVKSAEI